MNNTIYAISTYYHAFVTCVKQLVYKMQADVLVTGYIPEGEELAARLRESGLFDNVYYVNNPQEYLPQNKLDLLFNLHRRNAAKIETVLPMRFQQYQTVNIFHDDTWVAHYLKDCRIRYRLIEDGLDSFKTINETQFSYMVPKKSLASAIKRALRIGYAFCGYDWLTTEVEVNEKKGVVIADIAKGKLVEMPRTPMLDKLSEADINILRAVFSKELPTINPQSTVLLFTQPFYADNAAISQAEQAELYKLLVSENIDASEMLVIKPHPRDESDYSVIFPKAIVINKNMPSEMLKYYNITGIKKCFGFNSTALKTIDAENCICCDFTQYINKIRRSHND